MTFVVIFFVCCTAAFVVGAAFGRSGAWQDGHDAGYADAHYEAAQENMAMAKAAREQEARELVEDVEREMRGRAA